MGSRGPLPKRRAASARTADGVRLRRLPTDADAIAKRLIRDVPGLTPADVAIVEMMAVWVSVFKENHAELLEEGYTITDTAHGNKEESRKNPRLIVMNTASDQVLKMAQQLGATPLARARMPEPEHEQMTLADILFSDVAVDHE